MSSDREAVEMIVNQHGFKDDVEYGNTKLFVRTPRSLFSLEQERAALIPILVLFLQKVSPEGCFCFFFKHPTSPAAFIESHLHSDERVMS